MLPILCQISLPWQRGLIARPQQPPTRCKDLDDISYTNWVIVYFISNFVAMATGVGRGGICLTAFNSPTPKTPCCVQETRRYLPQKPSYWLFCFKFSLPWQQGLFVVEFVWRRSIAQPPKPPTRRKHLSDISHTSYVVTHFVPNFVAMATRVGLFKISLTSFDSLTPKTPS